MNIFYSDIMNEIIKRSPENQRELASFCKCSLGKVNTIVNDMLRDRVIDDGLRITQKGKKLVSLHMPKRAVILAAGQGHGTIPLENELPKALLRVQGEALIERQIRQLHEVGITDITVVTGYMKEKLEYLIDQFQLNLVYNPKYASRNNLHSLFLVRHLLEDAYIIPCDLWFNENPFRSFEPCSWYMVTDEQDPDSSVIVTKQKRLSLCKKDAVGSHMVGIAFVHRDYFSLFSSILKDADEHPFYRSQFWEAALFSPPERKRIPIVYARIYSSDKYVEVHTIEQLHEPAAPSLNPGSELLQCAADVLKCSPHELRNIRALKKGMTNRSFLFDHKHSSYIMRVPGEGTSELIDRKKEADVYEIVNRHNLCEPLLYISPKTGRKMTRFIKDAKNCNSESETDCRRAMDYLRTFHELQLSVPHTFDLFNQLEYYEHLWNKTPSVYVDYKKIKERIFNLRTYIDAQPKQWCLTHIDAVPDNFLFTDTRTYLIDWEYAGMQDPHVDIAMFAIYSLYDKQQVDHLIDLYFQGHASANIRLKIYCYIAVCGLLWSNWCEYKRQLGVDFGEYSIRQYRYAKEFESYFRNKEIPQS